MKEESVVDKLKILMNRCKSGANIHFNPHKGCYQSVEEYLDNISVFYEDLESEVGSDVWQEMIKRDEIVRIQFYPNTPIGFFTVLHYDISTAIDIAIKTLLGDNV